jgi:hypothetical protein
VDRIQELSTELSKLIAGDKVKFDVHFVISNPLSQYCAEINTKVSQYGASLIDLGNNSICVPHVTLLMGYINSTIELQKLLGRVAEYVVKLEFFTCKPTNLYFKGVSQTAPQYLFVDLNNRAFFEQQKESLKNHMAGYYSPLDWDILKERAHITIGCYKGLSDIGKTEIDTFHTPPECIIKQVGISICGVRGACLGHLKTYDLRT